MTETCCDGFCVACLSHRDADGWCDCTWASVTLPGHELLSSNEPVEAEHANGRTE